MEQRQRSAEYIFQGAMYFFRREKIQCRYQYTLKDPVDSALLQKAVDAALAAAPYYAVQLVWEKRDAFLEPNPNPCRVYTGSRMRDMPEETDGYMFCVSCEGAVVYFDWYHFLMDGRGVSPFLTRILEQYCNLRYGTAFANTPIVCSPAYDIEALVAQYPEQTATGETLQREVVQTCEDTIHRTRVRLRKKCLVDKAVAAEVKPFSMLLALLSMGVGQYLGKQEVQYSYSADSRDAVNAPNALYNCVCSYQNIVSLEQGNHAEDYAAAIDAYVRSTLTPEAKRYQMSQQMGWVRKVHMQKAPLRIKQRVFQMGEYIGGTISDFWLSYLGNPLMPATPELAQYTTDFGVWVPPEGASVGVEAASLNGKIILCIQNKAPNPGLAETLRKTFENEGVAVLEAEDLD